MFGSTPKIIGLIAAGFMLAFMIIGSLLADVIGRRTILAILATPETKHADLEDRAAERPDVVRAA